MTEYRSDRNDNKNIINVIGEVGELNLIPDIEGYKRHLALRVDEDSNTFKLEIDRFHLTYKSVYAVGRLEFFGITPTPLGYKYLFRFSGSPDNQVSGETEAYQWSFTVPDKPKPNPWSNILPVSVTPAEESPA